MSSVWVLDYYRKEEKGGDELEVVLCEIDEERGGGRVIFREMLLFSQYCMVLFSNDILSLKL